MKTPQTHAADRTQSRRPTALFLDFYGTLTAYARVTIETICQRVIDEFRLAGDPSAVAERWGRHFFRLIEQSNHERFRTLYECERDSFVHLIAEINRHIGTHRQVDADDFVRPLRDYLRRPPIYEDAFDILRQLDVPICLVTNADHDDVMAAVRHHGLDFDEVITSEDARCYKPEKGIFELALQRTGWFRDRVAYAGDSRHSDVDGAKRVGLISILIDRAGRVSDIGNAEPDYTFTDLRGLLTLFT